ncbi:MAG: hypothetical protein FJ202_07440 [Gemmatimonadetes bacterium]|nr:hypothetical protein [Gemmatimonadota bacterium]
MNGAAEVSSGALALAVIAIAQVMFLAALVAFVVVQRRRNRAQQVMVAGLTQTARDALRDWVAGGASVGPLVQALRGLPRHDALEFACDSAGAMLPPESRDELASALRHDAWMLAFIAQADAR